MAGNYHEATEHVPGEAGRPWGIVHYGVLRPGVPADERWWHAEARGTSNWTKISEPLPW